MIEVWVFHGAGSRFTSGVFTSRQQAEEFIQQYQLNGILTKYPLGISVYDWAQQEGIFQPTKPERAVHYGLYPALHVSQPGALSL